MNTCLDCDYDLGLDLVLGSGFHLCSGHHVADHHNVLEDLFGQDYDCDCVTAAARTFGLDLAVDGASHLYQKPCHTDQSGHGLQLCDTGVFVRD